MLIIRNLTNVFDTEEIQRGTLIYAKHKSWSNGERGFVVSVTGNKATNLSRESLQPSHAPAPPRAMIKQRKKGITPLKAMI